MNLYVQMSRKEGKMNCFRLKLQKQCGILLILSSNSILPVIFICFPSFLNPDHPSLGNCYLNTIHSFTLNTLLLPPSPISPQIMSLSSDPNLNRNKSCTCSKEKHGSIWVEGEDVTSTQILKNPIHIHLLPSFPQKIPYLLLQYQCHLPRHFIELHCIRWERINIMEPFFLPDNKANQPSRPFLV